MTESRKFIYSDALLLSFPDGNNNHNNSSSKIDLGHQLEDVSKKIDKSINKLCLVVSISFFFTKIIHVNELFFIIFAGGRGRGGPLTGNRFENSWNLQNNGNPTPVSPGKTHFQNSNLPRLYNLI